MDTQTTDTQVDMSAVGRALSTAARAENAKGYLLQAERATEDGAEFLREQAREALRDVLREAQAALTLLSLSGPQADLLERVIERGPTIVSGNELRTARALVRCGLGNLTERETPYFGGGRMTWVLQVEEEASR